MISAKLIGMEEQPRHTLRKKPSNLHRSDPLIAFPVARAYFFDQGLRFECQQCGQCCTGDPGTIFVGPDEVAPIAEYCRISEAGLIADYLYPFKDSYSIREDEKGRCLFFDNGCTIYDVRPLQCRTFPFWFDNLRSPVRWDRIQKQCPGIGRGKRYTKDEIMISARQTIHL